ncbi:MAG: glycerophosphodiester phosphodiesterase, partial [Acidobacteriota bacterium]|nr:glycerophosphodiester phosphodiesterase [Acidobacteriota bacterium]
LDAFRAALRLGVDGVELDVRRCADGALAVHHDEACEGRLIAKTPYRELPGYVCTLAEALATLDEVEVNVEIKNLPHEKGYDDSGAFVDAIARTVIDARAGERVLISSFDLATCVDVRRRYPEIAVGWLLHQVAVVDALAPALEHGFRALHPNYASVGAAEVARARDVGIDLNVWTVNHRRDLLRFTQWGVAALITDEPVTALALGPGAA